MNRHERVILIVLLVAFGIANFISTTPTALAQEDRWSGYTITGNTYFISGPRPGRTLPFKLIINRLTTPDEVRQLNSALQSGQDDLLRTLSRMNAGRIEVGSGVGVPANAILVTEEADGRTKLTVLYQRYLRFAELRYGARSEDYPFGYAELHVGRGEHEGMFIPAARVRLRNGNTWEVEDFGTFPARLMGLQVRGRGRVG
ncbi:MAG TPA: hypothetical protein VIX17_04130 [Pyrinomonadaceae bacterium]|jgi:hypothetical protein